MEGDKGWLLIANYLISLVPLARVERAAHGLGIPSCYIPIISHKIKYMLTIQYIMCY
jgi:hypothetical protein